MKPCPVCKQPNGFHDPQRHYRRHIWVPISDLIPWPHCQTCGKVQHHLNIDLHCNGPVFTGIWEEAMAHANVEPAS